ncbi:PTS sugar transporter subunit IIB [Lactiplantibacillus argentoratensis]|jgi:PTS system galactitol-specific IIB component|uniref:PTS sugar transporter subunit IIB n=1 Tax=Lactiplantibacillus argentoratensis TaxID=271881 RepID=UPI00073C199A|nr:PTS sugar transporter subunit IIB [Lactiplantibacillus argentoratensis]KTF00963.1 PTS system galactitol-specific IIB component [Lactiplantibacillus plantarum]GEK63079.1 PTS galactitol transporter subunit IIB [Lactobacillus japonicus]KZT81911.1 PTS system galactitol-specific IIB component [Lactiplantibacillus plantarum]MBP5809467.1 PTS sugar transporter subunit IIB [Lactiplantibacillus argentoratensis]MCA5597733.1 PTS sugar transporter subunit IIB [Lactiplantibacillus argentoratensis]
MKKILVACGSGIATSTVARNKLEEDLQDRGVNMSQISMNQTSIPQIPSMASEYDLIVTTARYKEDVGVPIINGLSFLTGIGEDAAVDKIVEVLEM